MKQEKEMINAYKSILGKTEGMNNLEEPGVDKRIILKWILVKQCGTEWTGFFWHGVWTCCWF
jgi:hypothetical protein